MAYADGHLVIDTRTDTAGFNKGVAAIGKSMKSFGKVLLGVAAGAAIAFALVLGVVGMIVRGLISMGKAVLDASQKAVGYAAKVEELKLMFANLKLAVTDAFKPLIMFALPWIEKVVAWVSSLLSLIAQVTAGLTGQSGYWKTTATSAGKAAASTKEVAENTKKAGEAAEGALASFDELNVLQMADEEKPNAGGGAGGTAQEWVSIGDKAAGIIEKIKEFFGRVKEFFAPLKEPLDRIWDSLGRIWEQVKKAAKGIWEDLGPSFIWFRDEVLVPVLDFLADIFEKIADWAEENPEKMKGIVAAFMLLGVALLLILSPAALVVAAILLIITVVTLLIRYWPEISRVAAQVVNAVIGFFVNLWNSIRSGAANMVNAVIGFFVNLWNSIRSGAANMVNAVFQFFLNLWTGIVNIWIGAKTWFQTKIIDPLVNAWDTATGKIKGFFTKLFDGVKSTVKSVVNGIIGFVNTLIQRIVGGVNDVIGTVNTIAGTKIQMVSAPQIPKLAKGAVIPPNASFLAVLGDQRTGKNIEAPENLIRQIVREETAGMGSGQEITINFGGSLGALVRELKPYIDKENVRIGRSLLKGANA